MAVAGTLVTKEYKNFRGVDFTNVEVKQYRSPDALNVWRNYKHKGEGITTRPDIELYESFDDSVFGLFFYEIEGNTQLIVHSGTKLYKIDNGTRNVIYNGMNEQKSLFFVYEKSLFIKDGKNYLEYNGKTCEEVVGYVPITTTSKSPTGEGKTFQDANMLTGVRKNRFVADGISTEYFVDVESFDTDYKVRVWVNDEELTSGFSTDASTGKIIFETAPAVPDTVGQDNVIVEFKKEILGEREKINKCTLLEVFDNRVFFAGNPDYPNKLWHCSLEDPTYCSDLDKYTEGIDDSKIKALVSGNNALWVMKEPSQSNTTIFYHNPTIDDETGKVYPSIHSSISTGCTSTGINFNDDICFFSDRGLEAISGDVTTEQVLAHRSTFVDKRLLNETNYNNLLLEEWEGYLLVFVDNKVYLADSQAIATNINHNEYEWFYWELSEAVICTRVKNGTLYIGTNNGIYTLTKADTEIDAYWTTPLDEFEYPQMQKTTNKRGCVADMEGEEITISVKVDNRSFEEINTYQNTKGYVVPRIKKKKWKGLQLKFSSSKPFSLYSCTLESYIGNYVKR